MVEFFGVPRQRTGVARTQAEGRTLSEVLADLARRFPAFAASCLDGDQLRAGYMASIDAERFLTVGSTPLADGQTILILSADAGG